MPEMKPCPFCGGEADYDNDTGLNDDYFVEWYYCTKCGARTKSEEIWNTRVSPVVFVSGGCVVDVALHGKSVEFTLVDHDLEEPNARS